MGSNPTPRTNSLVIHESQELAPSGLSPGGRTTENFRWLGSRLLIVLDVNVWLSHGTSGCLLFSIWILEALQMDLNEFITNGDDATGAVQCQENRYDALLSACYLGLEAKVPSSFALICPHD